MLAKHRRGIVRSSDHLKEVTDDAIPRNERGVQDGSPVPPKNSVIVIWPGLTAMLKLP